MGITQQAAVGRRWGCGSTPSWWSRCLTGRLGFQLRGQELSLRGQEHTLAQPVPTPLLQPLELQGPTLHLLSRPSVDGDLWLMSKLISPNTEEPTTDGSPGRRRRSWDYVKQLMNPTDDSTETDEDDREDEDDDDDGSPGRRRRPWDYVKQFMNPTTTPATTPPPEAGDATEDGPPPPGRRRRSWDYLEQLVNPTTTTTAPDRRRRGAGGKPWTYASPQASTTTPTPARRRRH